MRRIVVALVLAEWRALLRQRVALSAAVLLLALIMAASLASLERMRVVAHDRAHFQNRADAQWDAQPDRHPHRVVHYGHYVFRPLSPLAFFDFGVDPFAGHMLYLEGHRQNSANFSEAGQFSVLLRFGQLTPAFVLQVLAPLLIVFLAFGSVAREREQGQLRLLMAHGTPGHAIVAAKLAAHGGLALLLASPAFGALAVVAWRHDGAGAQALSMMAAYALYLLLWSTGAVLVSALARRARASLLALCGCWVAMVVLLPRIVPDIAARLIERPMRVETDAASAIAMAALGDSHDPDDPHFARFRARILQRYGRARVEDLPVNYGALVIEEGEHLGNAVFERAMRADAVLQQRQNALVDLAAVATPAIALRRLSTALAGTDGAGHARFLRAAEHYRYALIQALNRLHVTEVAYQNDRDQRLDRAHWRRMPHFAYRPAGMEALHGTGLAWAMLAGWALALAGAAVLVARRLDRAGA